MRRLTQAWRQPGVVLDLLLSDALVAVLVWIVAYDLQSIWGWWEGFPGRRGLQTAIVAGVFAVAVWIELRSLLGLYPGYGLSLEERLRRHTYSVVGTLAAVSFAIALNLGAIAENFGTFELYSNFPRLLLALGFVGLLLLSPLVQGLARWGVWRLGFWGRPVVVIGDKDTSARTVKLLKDEWVLGYAPAALIDWGLTLSGKPLNGLSHADAMTQDENLARRGGVDTIILAAPYIRRSHLAPLVSRASRSFRHVLLISHLGGDGPRLCGNPGGGDKVQPPQPLGAEGETHARPWSYRGWWSPRASASLGDSPAGLCRVWKADFLHGLADG
jgi:hypothetical protein